MVFSAFIIICFLVCVALWFFTMISGDLLANTKWNIISVISSRLFIVLLLAGVGMIAAVLTTPLTAPDNEILCTYRLQDSGTQTPSSFDIMTDTIFLTDENNNTLTISTWTNEVQYISDHKYPLVERIRVKTFFIYRDLFLVHL